MKRFVVWGGRESLDSIRHVLRHYFDSASKLGYHAVWLKDEPASAPLLSAGDTILAVDVAAHHLPFMPDARYVLHNFDGSVGLCQALEETPQNLLRLQVYTSAASGERWGPARYFDREARTLFQPWGSDLLKEEFLAPVVNPEARTVPFIGAIWSDQYQGVELGNEAVIEELKQACGARGLVFTHRSHVPDSENVRVVRSGRLAPAFAGEWQATRDYFPCRVAKAAAYGQLPLTNVPVCLEVLGGAALRGSVDEVVEQALSLNRSQYLNLVREAQRGVSELTYRESLASIERAFAEIAA